MRRRSKKVRLPVTTTQQPRPRRRYLFLPSSCLLLLDLKSLSVPSFSRGHMWNCCELTSHSWEEFRRRRSVRPSVLMANEVVINLGKWTPQKSPKERKTDGRTNGMDGEHFTFSTRRRRRMAAPTPTLTHPLSAICSRLRTHNHRAPFVFEMAFTKWTDTLSRAATQLHRIGSFRDLI